MTLRTVVPVCDHQRRALRFCTDWVTGSVLQGSRAVGLRNRRDREALGRSSDWVLQVGTTSARGNPPRREEVCTRGHTLCEEKEGMSRLKDPPRHFILIAVPVNWNPPTRELAVLVREESQRSCLVPFFVTDLKQFTDGVITALPAQMKFI